jgi:signal transduction histidine kinase
MPALYAYFPITAVLSLVSTMQSGASAEVALVGREGMIGLAGVLGTVESPTSAVVQIGGDALRLPTAALRAARNANPSIRKALDLYTEARLIQVAQTAACNRLHSVEARLARWLLALHARIEGDEFTVAQEFIGDMLGVHRPTVSTALQRLQDHGVIARRGRAIVVTNRRLLEGLACECHQVIEREFARLFTEGPRGSDVVCASPGTSDEPHMTAALEATREIAGRLLLATIREQEAREHAEAANRAKDQFLAMVSHELRAPLTAILGWCGIVAKQKELALDRGLVVIERNARAQLKLVEELLDAARVTSATLTIHPRHIGLQDLVQSAVDTIKPAAEEKHVVLRLAMPDALPGIFADADRMRQVLVNVLGNSLKFTDAGGFVDVQVTAEADRVQVTVEDTGRGIASDVLPHVFERFRQGASEQSGRGLGLGLAIARALVELHGGTIALESAGENQGTTCRINLPVADVAGLTAQAAPSAV